MPPLMRLKNDKKAKPPRNKEIIPEIRAPSRKFLTKVLLLYAKLNPSIGHRPIAAIKINKPIISGEDPLKLIPMLSKKYITIEGRRGIKKPTQKLRSSVTTNSKYSSFFSVLYFIEDLTRNSLPQWGQPNLPE